MRLGRRKWLGSLAVGLAFAGWLALFAPGLAQLVQDWSRVEAAVPIERTSWTKTADGSTRAYELELPAQTLKRAEERGASVLYLGEFFAPYSVLIDGVPATAGLARGPVFVPLSTQRLQAERPLRVHIEVIVPPEGGLPAAFMARGAARTVAEGFVTPADQTRIALLVDVYRRVRPAAFTLAYLVVSAIFFALWRSAPLRLDSFGMAAFTMSTAFYQATRTDFLAEALTHNTYVWLGVMLKGSFAATGATLGFAFARWRPRAVWTHLFGALVLSAIGAAIAPHLAHTRVIESFIEDWVVPPAFIVGGLACMVEALALGRQPRDGTGQITFRIRSLVAFGAAMAAVGAYYFALQRDLIPGRVLSWLFMGSETFGLVAFLSTLALRDYRSQQKLLARIPVSPYHQLDPLPGGISGALLMVDIKNSELLFRIGAAEGNAGMLVDRCLSHLWSAVSRAGGFVLRTDGDGLAAFFVDEKFPRPMEAALAATDLMCAELKLLSEQFVDEGYLPASALPLDFRGSVTLGQIRPIWLEIGGTRAAAWTEAGTRNTFVDGSRLLELERSIGIAGTELLVQERDTPTTQIHEWTRRSLSLTGKHGATYQVAVYIPRQPNAAQEHSAKRAA